MQIYKTVFFYHVGTGNRGDMAIKKAITDAIRERIDVPFAFFNTKYEELTEQRIINQLNPEGSCLAICGSGLYTNYPMSSGWYFPCKTELFNKIKIPIMLIGIGRNNTIQNDIYKGDLKPEAAESIKLINNLASVSTVRDQRTYKFLKELGINKHELMLDPGNFLNVARVPKEKRVAINIAQHIPPLGRFDGTQDERNKNIQYFTKISEYLMSKGYKIVFMAHDALEHSAIMDLRKNLPELEYVNTDNIDIMLKEYARCEFAISMKMHSCILAFAARTPFFTPYYDWKSIEYLKMINWSSFGVNCFTDYYNVMKEKVDDLIDNNKYYVKQLEKIKKLEQIEFDRLIDKVCEIIANQK